MGTMLQPRMSLPPTTSPVAPEFDQFAGDYDAALNAGLKFSGEAKEFFAENRVKWLKRRLGGFLKPASRCLDYGCGTGTATPYLMETLGLAQLTGVDLSEESLAIARKDHGSPLVSFQQLDTLQDLQDVFDLGYCNGVFHHIPLAERPGCAASIFRAMKPGATFALWENNAWNPMVRFIMSRVPFDADAIMLFPGEARRLMRDAGFEVIGTDFLFVFPGALAPLRVVEPALCKLPLGGQYQVLCRKPMH